MDIDDEHPRKQSFPIEVTEFGIEMNVDDEHPRKQSFQLK
jgi:hypothetical protein